VYEKRDAEAETLHRVVRENLATFYAAVEEGWVDGGLPEFVRVELAGYLWSEPCARAPARAPPYHRAVTRLLPTRQQQLFADT
jgi:hypothetical protein